MTTETSQAGPDWKVGLANPQNWGTYYAFLQVTERQGGLQKLPAVQPNMARCCDLLKRNQKFTFLCWLQFCKKFESVASIQKELSRPNKTYLQAALGL